MFLLTVLYFLHLKKPTLLHVERVLFDPQCQLRRVFQVSVSEAHEMHMRYITTVCSQVVLASGYTFLEMLANKYQN